MAKKLDLPSFAKATKGFSLSSALVTEEIYVQTGAEAEAFSFTDFDKPWGSGGESFSIDALGHEEDLVERDRGTFFAPNPLKRRCYEGFKAGEEVFDFGQIVFG